MKARRDRVGVVSLLALFFGACAAEEDPDSEEKLHRASWAQQATPEAQDSEIDLSGTWGARVKTRARITAPIIGASEAPVDLAIKLVVSRGADRVSADVQICSLTSDSSNLKVDYARLLPYLKLTVSAAPFEARVGTKVPLPPLVFRAGLTEAGTSVDVDGDGRPGGALPIVALGLIPIQTYAGLSLSVSMDATVRGDDVIDGTATFSGTGKVFGSNSPLLTSGDLRVEQTQNPTSFTAKRLAADVPCATLVTQI